MKDPSSYLSLIFKESYVGYFLKIPGTVSSGATAGNNSCFDRRLLSSQLPGCSNKMLYGYRIGWKIILIKCLQYKEFGHLRDGIEVFLWSAETSLC